MNKLLPSLAVLCLGIVASPAMASVEYQFDSSIAAFARFKSNFSLFGDSFDYKTSNFITTYTKVSAEDANCSVAFGTCTSVEFNPTSSSDSIIINYNDEFGAAFVKLAATPLVFSDSDQFDFDPGTFSKPGGPYPSNDTFSQGSLTVISNGMSPVPLPASAPMFGAALLALGAVGYGVKRKKAAAAA